MLRTAVVLAAGRGTRIRESDQDLPKPLQLVAGISLLKRTLLTLRAGGISQFFIVVGFMADEIRNAVAEDAELASLGVVFVDNPNFERSNGLSVIAVASVVTEPFVLSMADHVYDRSLVELAVAAEMNAADLYLCVDRRVHDIYDLPDATKVETVNDHIVNIGKELTTFDCVDCGVFAVSTKLCRALEAVRAATGDCSLSSGVAELARLGRARVLDIGDAFWQDVDTQEALNRAEQILRQGA
jgi:1L-myo-inositol 1-phosphate cytidylyltransferase